MLISPALKFVSFDVAVLLLLLPFQSFGGQNCSELFSRYLSPPRQTTLDLWQKGYIQKGTKVFNIKRSGRGVLRSIPQIASLYRGSLSSARPVLIDLGAGNGQSAFDLSQPQADNRYFDMLAITAEEDTVEETDHLRILAGQFFESTPIWLINEKIKYLRAKNLRKQMHAELADGGWDLYGVFSYSTHPDFVYSKLLRLIKMGAEFDIITTSGEIKFADGEYPGQPVEYRAGTGSSHQVLGRSSMVITLAGSVYPLFDYLASLGGFQIDYWNHGQGPIELFNANKSWREIRTHGDVTRMTKIEEHIRPAPELEVVYFTSDTPPFYVFRQKPNLLSASERLAYDRFVLQQLPSFFTRVAKTAMGEKKGIDPVLAALILDHFLPQALLSIHHFVFREVYSSLLAIKADKEAAVFFRKYDKWL